MALFPTVRTLIAPPSQVWSRSGTATLGSAKARYPASNAVDGITDSVARSTATTDSLAVDLGSAQTPNIFGVINHNITHGLVCGFQASTSGGFGSLALDRAAAARAPNFWLDLRGFPASAQYWRLNVNATASALSIGEVVVATGFEFDGVLKDPPREDLHVYSERATLEYGRTTISSSASIHRSTTLTLSMTAADLVNFEQICDEVGALSDERIVVVPDSRRNDVWFVEWPQQRDISYTVSDQDLIEVSLTLPELPGGIV